jgi:mannose/fructose/N-acetylgalactosamine-specific phosphotransferase system component IIB
VDQRLVHGQVTVAWVPALGIRRILVADDDLAADDFEREIVESSGPPGVPVEVLDVESAGRRLAGVPEETLCLVRWPETLLRLVRGGAPIREAMLGGLYHRVGSRRFLDYLYLTPADLEALDELARRGVRLTARDVPTGTGIPLNPLLAEGRLAFDRLPPGGS